MDQLIATLVEVAPWGGGIAGSLGLVVWATRIQARVSRLEELVSEMLPKLDELNNTMIRLVVLMERE